MLILGTRIFRVGGKKKIKYQIKKLSKNSVLTWMHILISFSLSEKIYFLALYTEKH